jgi:Spy/CpxP family protein refolding chaperone
LKEIQNAMKNTWFKLTAVTAVAGGLLMASGQTAPPQPAQPTPQQQRMHNRRERLAQYLNLTPAQKAQFKADSQAMRQSAQPLHAQLKQMRQGMAQAIRANDTAAIDRLSAQEANLKGQLSALRHESMARMYANLTPDQKAKADQLPAHMRQMRQQRSNQAPNNG